MAKKASAAVRGASKGIEGTGFDSGEIVDHAKDIYGIDKPEPIPEPTVEPDPHLEVPAKEPEPEPVAAVAAVAETPPAEPTEDDETPAEPAETPPTDEPPEPAPEPEAVTEPGPTAEIPEVPPTPEPAVAPAPEPKPTAEEAMIHQMQKLRSRNDELERAAAISQTGAPPYQPPPAAPVTPPGTAPPPPPPIPYAEDGTAQMPDVNDPAFRAYIREAVAPTPVEQHQMAQAAIQQEFDIRKAAFVAEDPRRAPIADRVEQASRMVQLRGAEIMKRTGEKPQGLEQEAAFIERNGIGAEFRQYVPEIPAEGMTDFIDAMFWGSVQTQERYMRDFCGRLLAPETPAVPPKPPVQAQQMPAEIPPRLAGQGTPNLEREGKPGKQERLAELSAQKGADPHSFTPELNAEWSRLVKDLGFEV